MRNCREAVRRVARMHLQWSVLLLLLWVFMHSLPVAPSRFDNTSVGCFDAERNHGRTRERNTTSRLDSYMDLLKYCFVLHKIIMKKREEIYLRM
jgi:hypothetical protein